MTLSAIALGPTQKRGGADGPPSLAEAVTHLDGPAPTVLAHQAPKGELAVGFVHADLPGSSRLSSTTLETRLSFVFRAPPGTEFMLRACGRRHRHNIVPTTIWSIPGMQDIEFGPSSSMEVLSISIPEDLMSLALGEINASRRHVVERVGVEDAKLRQLAISLRHQIGSDSPSAVMRWAELSSQLALQVAADHLPLPSESRQHAIGATSLKNLNEFITESLYRTINLDDLSAIADQSRFQFLRAFAKTVGMTPSRYVMHRRLQAAISLVRHGNEPYADIACATGFADQSHLSRWCKRIYGLRLTEVRGA